MIVDQNTTETLTNETRYGLPVYQKIVKVSMTTGSSSVHNTAHGITFPNNYYWLDLGNSYIAKGAEWHYPIVCTLYDISIHLSKQHIAIYNTDDWTGFTAHIVVKYCKET